MLNEPAKPGIRTVRSVERAIDALEAVARHSKPMTLGQIAEVLRAPKSTTLNIVRTLVRRRALDVDPATKAYRLGWFIAGLAGSFSDAVDLRALAKPHLDDLAQATQETALLAVLSGNEVVFVEKIDSGQPIRYIAQVGTRRPLHCTASGKLYLAFLPPANVDAYVATVGLVRYARNTITDRRRLAAELARIRARGYAIADCEFLPDLLGIAMPVRRLGSEDIVAAVLVAGPAFRMRRQVRRLLPLVRRTAELIGRDITRFGMAGTPLPPAPDVARTPPRGRRG